MLVFDQVLFILFEFCIGAG